MRISEFAAAVGVSVRTVTRYVNEGRFAPTYRTEGGHMRFGKEKIREWLDLSDRGRGSIREKTESITLVGTTTAQEKQSASAFVREITLKRRLVSRNF